MYYLLTKVYLNALYVNNNNNILVLTIKDNLTHVIASK